MPCLGFAALLIVGMRGMSQEGDLNPSSIKSLSDTVLRHHEVMLSKQCTARLHPLRAVARCHLELA